MDIDSIKNYLKSVSSLPIAAKLQAIPGWHCAYLEVIDGKPQVIIFQIKEWGMFQTGLSPTSPESLNGSDNIPIQHLFDKALPNLVPVHPTTGNLVKLDSLIGCYGPDEGNAEIVLKKALDQVNKVSEIFNKIEKDN
jgi:hypothetical protein